MINDLTTFIVAGTFGTLILALALIYFVVSYQRKRYKTQIHIQEIQTKMEKQSTIASFRGQENERQRIAKDLHDDISTSLTAIKMSLNFLSEKLDKGSVVQDELLDIRDTLAVSINNVRNISHNLMPYALANLGLTKSVEQLVLSISNPPELSAKFHSEGELVKLNDEVRLMVFRSIQEIINNSIKHSKANKIEVIFDWTDIALHIAVCDNGKGFDYEKVTGKTKAGIGLKNLESRLRIIGASKSVTSGEQGTAFDIIVPLNNETISA